MRSDCDCSAAGDCVLVAATVRSDHEEVLRTTFVPLVLHGDEGDNLSEGDVWSFRCVQLPRPSATFFFWPHVKEQSEKLP